MSIGIRNAATLTKRQIKRAVKAFTPLHRITTTIQRHWLDQILTGKKKIEYRELKPYWYKRLGGTTCAIEVPFELRLINGMSKKAPEATVLIKKVDIGTQQPFDGYFDGLVYRLHIGKILSVKNWKP